MLRESPERSVDVALDDEPVRGEAEEVLYCAACGAEVTRGRWRIAVGGEHERTVANPAGAVFVIQAFREAPGAVDVGASSHTFSWYKGYAWTVSVCRACATHLGWRFDGADEPPVFFALIRPRLTDRPPE